MIERALAGAVIAGGIAVTAHWARALSPSGAIAATVVGTIAIAAGWGWGALLIAYFVASVLVSRWGASYKAARTAAIVAKGGVRDAWQVGANGGVFALTALGALGVVGSPHWWSIAGAGALAAAAADTWSTEIGTRVGGTPRSILSRRPVPAGTSGGVTLWGSVGAIAGGAFVAMVAVLCGWRVAHVAPIAVAGLVGAFADSLLGAAVQSVNRCPACGTFTERAVHDCGSPTVPASGWRWMTNDAVNCAATVIGAATALALAGG